MFIILKPNKNYAYLFFIIIGITLFSTFSFGEKVSGFIFFLCFYYIGVLQVRSNVVLDRTWTAKSKLRTENSASFYVGMYLPFIIGTIGLILVFFFGS